MFAAGLCVVRGGGVLFPVTPQSSIRLRRCRSVGACCRQSWPSERRRWTRPARGGRRCRPDNHCALEGCLLL